MCVPCSLDFPNDADYYLHKKGGHADKSKGNPIVGPGIEPPQDFIEAVKRIEAKKDEPPPAPPPAPDQPRPTMPDPNPIVLTYSYTGDCPTCRNPVSTLELDVKDLHCIVAYCPRCNKQLSSREEKKL